MTKPQTCNCKTEETDAERYAMLEDVLEEYKDKPGALIPILQIAQRIFGYLPKDVLKKVSTKLGKSYSEVAGVVSFYSFFSTQPRGEYVIRVCLGTACYVRGGKEVLAALKRELKIDVGETSGDLKFSLDVGRCFGACGLAPVIMVNDNVHQRVKAEKINDILVYYRKENKEMKEAV